MEALGNHISSKDWNHHQGPSLGSEGSSPPFLLHPEITALAPRKTRSQRVRGSPERDVPGAQGGLKFRQRHQPLLCELRVPGQHLPKAPHSPQALRSCWPDWALALARHGCQAQVYILGSSESCWEKRKKSPQVWSERGLAHKLCQLRRTVNGDGGLEGQGLTCPGAGS